MAMAISSVTSPRSSRDETERTADEVGQKVLNRAAFEDDGEKPGEAGGCHRGNRVFGGCGPAVGGWILRNETGLFGHVTSFTTFDRELGSCLPIVGKYAKL
jgi:hypothetical protein